MDRFLKDLRYGLRMLARAPGVTALALLSLGLGIGANTTIFTWTRAALLNPLPGVEEVDRLALVLGRLAGGRMISVSVPDYLDYRDRSQTFSGVVAHSMYPLIARIDAEPENVWSQIVSGNFFEVLGVAPIVGRTFLPEEDRTPGTHAVTVISERLWMLRFGGDPEILDRTITLNGESFSIVGVVPAGFQGSIMGLSFDLWVPLMMSPALTSEDYLESRSSQWLNILGRLAPGRDLADARAEFGVLSQQLAEEYPAHHENRSAVVLDLNDDPFGGASILKPVIFVLTVVVGVVLLIACANVANLLLTRAVGRQREVAIRLAVGASRGRIVAQLLTESVLLALLASGLGLILALACTRVLAAIPPPAAGFPLYLQAKVDVPVLLFTLAVSVATGLLFGLAPALHARRADLVTALKDEGATTAGVSRSLLRDAFVVVQVAASLTLLVVAGLLLRSLLLVQKLDPGFATEETLIASLNLGAGGYSDQEGFEVYRRIIQSLEAVPGVRSVSMARSAPLGLGNRSSRGVAIEGYESAPGEDMSLPINIVGPHYLRTMGIPLVRGRDLGEQLPTVREVVVNETMAERYWQGRSAIGGRVRIGGQFYEVVGVARSSYYYSLNEDPMPFLFMPLVHFYQPDTVLHVRAEGDPLMLLDTLRSEVLKVDSDLPLFDVRPLAEQFDAAAMPQAIGAAMLAPFSLLALLLASMGLYGVMSFAVSQRRQEIGIRMALGADGRSVHGLFVRRGVLLTLIGTILGVLIIVPVGRLVETLLLGASANDPVVFLTVIAVLWGAAFLACSIPASRASRYDPIRALRYE